VDLDTNAVPAEKLTISKDGKVAAKLTSDLKGRATIRFELEALPESKHKALMKVIGDFLADS